MGETVRFGVSMDSDLVDLLDEMTQQKGHPNRSETLRGLVRQELVNETTQEGEHEVLGTVTLLYQKDTSLCRVSVEDFPSVKITANLKLHADQDICVKVIVVQGKADEVQAWAQKLLSCRNVIGKLNIAATDELTRELIKNKG